MKSHTNLGHGSDGAKLAPKPANGLAVVRAYLTTFRMRCEAAGWLHALFHVSVLDLAVQRAEQERAAVARDGYTAEQADLEAVKLLQEAARDGLSQADMPALAAAIRHIQRSAEKDHAIAATA